MPRWLKVTGGLVAVILGCGMIAFAYFLMAYGALNAGPSGRNTGLNGVELGFIAGGIVIILLGFACFIWAIRSNKS